MFEPLAVASLMRDYGIKPKKGLGQNFLTDETYLAKITEAAHIDKNKDVLEIGAGMGNLTRHLAAAARHVTAVELDRQLIPILKKVTRDFANVRIVQGDILELPLNDMMDAPGYVVAANIPYYSWEIKLAGVERAGIWLSEDRCPHPCRGFLSRAQGGFCCADCGPV
jgi:16S rRNA (adenine1518-N6/adenine1519-N6)-dimethyltransferase